MLAKNVARMNARKTQRDKQERSKYPSSKLQYIKQARRKKVSKQIVRLKTEKKLG